MSQVRGFFILGAILVAFASANAADLKEARVTQIIRDVKLLPNAAPARPPIVNDPVRDGTAVRTGIESRTELTFADATLARLGANTIFSFTEGTRNLVLTDGAMLLRVPKNAGGAKINTAAVTAAITGTTVMLEFHKNSYVKFIVVQGTGRIIVRTGVGESLLVHPVQIVMRTPDAYALVSNNELTTAGPPKVVAGATTNYGKVYRNTPLDGIRSLWFFRTTRAFDSASGFDTPDRSVFDLNNIAVFKFQNLQLV